VVQGAAPRVACSPLSPYVVVTIVTRGRSSVCGVRLVQRPTVAAVKGRWLIVLTTAAALVLTPIVINARSTRSSEISVAALAQRVQGSGGIGWSGFVQSSGTLDVPDSESFANLAQLLGESNNLRVWWRDADNWRVDRIRSTGETDLFRQGEYSIRWVFESETATISPVSKIRLPDASDLLPPPLGRSMLQGAREDELTSLPPRRIAGIDAAGLRLVPAETGTSVGQVDVWADPQSGLPLQVELYGAAEARPVLRTALRELTLGTPDVGTTRFAGAAGIQVNYEESVDVAAAANAFAPGDLPASLGGLRSRTGEDPSAVGIYGRGPTTLIALPLRREVAGPLRQRLRDSAAAQETDVGTVSRVGPVGLMVTPYRGDGSRFLLAGTVTPEALTRAATDLLASA
jgi:hypothetical protein